VGSVKLDAGDPHAARIESQVRFAGEGDCRFDVHTTWTVLGNGCVNVIARIEPHAAPAVLPRLGLRMELPAEMSHLAYLGRGPQENYPDRKTAADVGLYESTVAGQFVPYVETQECGAKEDVRWAALTRDDGTGLLAVAGTTFSLTALPYTSQELAKARHPVELPESRRVLLCLDYAQNGLGGGSCGPRPMDKYLLRPEPATLVLSLRPYRPEMGRPAKVAREMVPVLPPVEIRRDAQGRVHLSCEHLLAKIRYTTDGSDPRRGGWVYNRPFDLTDGGTVRAVALSDLAKYRMIPSPLTEARFDLLIPRGRMKVVYCDSQHPGEGVAAHAIDGDPGSYWHTRWGTGEPEPPHEIQIDLGAVYELRGFTYLPRQDGDHGRIARYEFYVSRDGKDWGRPVASGRWPNSGELQRVLFDRPVTGRFIRLRALSEVRKRAWTTVAELNVLATRRISRP